MALTQEQITFAGVYGELKHVANRFFTRRIKNGKIPFRTNAQTISLSLIHILIKILCWAIKL